MCVKRVRTLNCHHKILALYLMISTYVSHAKLKVATALVVLSALIVLLCYKCRQSVNLSSVIERQEDDVVAQDLPERALAPSRVKEGGSANHVLSGKLNNADAFKSRQVLSLVETMAARGASAALEALCAKQCAAHAMATAIRTSGFICGSFLWRTL